MKQEENLLHSPPLIALVGPTAIGKTGLVLELAERLGAEVVNLDSMQVYRHMDIGTAKPTPAERGRVCHHLLDLVNPDEEYNVRRFIVDAERACREIVERGKVPILTGGTGLYLKGFQEGLFAMGTESPEEDKVDPAAEKVRTALKLALLEQGRAVLHKKLAAVDPASAARIHLNDTSRLLRALEVYELTGLPWSEHLARQQEKTAPGKSRKRLLKIGLTRERPWLYERINLRAALMLEGGFVDEVENLLALGFGRELKPMQAIGYRHVGEFLAGERNREETLELLSRDTRRYAKRQLTWFQADPEIVWFRPEQLSEISELIERYLERFGGWR